MFSSKIESVNWRLKLNNNFHIWKECIQSILSANQCAGTIMQDYSLGDENHKLLDRKAYSILLQCLNDQDILLVMGSSSMYVAWNLIVNSYEKSSGARVQSKFKELMNLKIEFGHLKDGVMKFSLLINEIEKMIGCKMNEAVKCHHLIAVLPDGLESVVNSFIVMKMTDLKFNDLKEAIMVKEVLVNDKSNVFLTNEDNCVMLTHKKFFGKARKVFHRNQPNQSFRGKVSRKCFSCGSDKHLIRDCKSNHVMIAETDLSKTSENYVVPDSFVAATYLQRTQYKNMWILDSGATDHHIVDELCFKKLDKCVSSVKCANGLSSPVKGIGEVMLSCKVDDVSLDVHLTNARFAPCLSCNLVSVRKLVEKGAKIIFENDIAHVSFDNRKCMVAKLNSFGLYELLLSEQDLKKSCNFVMNIWHDRLGHPGKDITDLMKREFPSLKFGSCDNCDTCFRTKLKQLSYPLSVNRASKPLEIIHTDVCGPIESVSFDGFKYFVIFVDDYSKFCVLYNLKSRSEVFDCFRHFKKYIENKLNFKIVNLKSDNAGEFSSLKFESFLNENGIHHMKSVPYCHQQNGRAERCIQKIQQLVRSLLFHSGLPVKYWSLAVLTAVYVMNRTSNTVTKRIPFDLLFNKKPDIKFFRTFGSVAYRWIHKDKREKFKPTSEKLIFVGYCDQYKAYKLLDIVNNRVIVDRNVKVIDNLMVMDRCLDSDFKLKRDEVDCVDSCCQSVMLTTSSCGLPKNYHDVLKHEAKDEWLKAILDEHQSLIDCNVFEEVDDCNQKVIDTKWVFAEKKDKDGVIVRYKARLVAKGFKQEYGIDYYETFSPVCEKNTLRLMLTLAGMNGWLVHQLDVKTAFLNGDLNEEVFVKPPLPLVNAGKLWKLKKSLYGLKQAPRCWNQCLNSILLSDGFKVSKIDSCLYWKEDVFVLVYVDDILIMSKDPKNINQVKLIIEKKVNIHDLGIVKRFLNINIEQKGDMFMLDQSDYIMKLAKRFNLDECKRTLRPLSSGIGELEKVECDLTCKRPIRALIGGLLYIANVSRPDIMASVSLLSRFLERPSELLWKSACQVLRYLVSTRFKKLQLGHFSNDQLQLYVDADFGSDASTRKSQSGIVIKLFGSTIVWASKKQSTVSMSSSEAEYVALSTGCSYLLGIMNLLEEIGINVKLPINVYEDNKTTICMVKNGGIKVKHIDVKYHFIKDLVNKNIINIKFVSSCDQVADVLTKANPKSSFEKICNDLNLSNQGEML